MQQNKVIAVLLLLAISGSMASIPPKPKSATNVTSGSTGSNGPSVPSGPNGNSTNTAGLVCPGRKGETHVYTFKSVLSSIYVDYYMSTGSRHTMLKILGLDQLFAVIKFWIFWRSHLLLLSKRIYQAAIKKGAQVLKLVLTDTGCAQRDYWLYWLRLRGDK